MSAVLKASFWENDQKTELRRFQIDFLDGDCSYNLLRKKLQSYHEDKVITSVSWTDEDGDEIIVDNDEDVKVVVQNCSADTAGSGVVKLNVHLSILDKREGGSVRREDREDNNIERMEVDPADRGHSPVLAALVTAAQTLGLDPGPSSGHVTVISYLASLVAGVGVRVTKSVIVMGSLAALSLLSLVLPAIIINTLVYFIIAAGLGLPMATVLLGHTLFLLASLSPSYIVTAVSVWAIRTLLQSKKNYFLQKSLEYWNKTLDDVLSKDEFKVLPPVSSKKGKNM